MTIILVVTSRSNCFGVAGLTIERKLSGDTAQKYVLFPSFPITKQYSKLCGVKAGFLVERNEIDVDSAAL